MKQKEDIKKIINSYIDIQEVNDLLKSKNISKDQIDKYIKNEFEIDHGLENINNGTFPTNKEDGELIMNYLKNTVSKANSTSVKKTGKLPLYVTNPGDYQKNDIDKNIINDIANEQGWKKSTLYKLVWPDNPKLVSQLFTNSTSRSVLRLIISSLQAALGVNYYYLIGECDSLTGRTNKKHIQYFPRDNKKKFTIRNAKIKELKDEYIEKIAEYTGLSQNILKRSRDNYTFQVWYPEDIAINIFKAMIEIPEFTANSFSDIFYFNGPVPAIDGVYALDLSDDDNDDNGNSYDNNMTIVESVLSDLPEYDKSSEKNPNNIKYHRYEKNLYNDNMTNTGYKDGDNTSYKDSSCTRSYTASITMRNIDRIRDIKELDMIIRYAQGKKMMEEAKQEYYKTRDEK